MSSGGVKKASCFDLESGFPGVGFAPEGSYFSPLSLKVRFLRIFEGSKKASRFDLESGFPRVGFAPEGLYFGPLSLKVCFLQSSGWSPKHKTFSLGPVQRFSGSGTGSGTGSGPGSAVQRFSGSAVQFLNRKAGSAVQRFGPVQKTRSVPVQPFRFAGSCHKAASLQRKERCFPRLGTVVSMWATVFATLGGVCKYGHDVFNMGSSEKICATLEQVVQR